MGIGLSGMVSGLDTDSIVKAMVSAQQQKATKVENKITLNKWTTEAWSSLNTKIYSFYTKFASKLRLQSSYMTRTAKSSDESIATATAGSSAAVGSHTLQIKKLASSQYVTGGQLGKANTYNKNTKLTEIGGTDAGVKAGTIITITGKKGTDSEKVTKLEVTENTTVNDFLEACKKSGLTASFDTNQQRFFISSSQSGEEDAFSIETSKLSGTATTAFNDITELIDTTTLSSTEKTAYENAMATLRQNTDAIEKALKATDTAAVNQLNKTEKAVYDAINVVKDAAVKTRASEEEDKKIETALLNAKNSDDKTIAYGETKLKYDTLFTEVETKIKENNEATALKAAKDAVAKAELVKEDGKAYAAVADVNATKYNEADSLITNTKVAKAEVLIEKLETKGTITSDVATELKNAYKVLDENRVEGNVVAKEQIDKLVEDGKITSDDGDELKAAYAVIEAKNVDLDLEKQIDELEGLTSDEVTALKNAYAIKNTWEADYKYKVTDASGNETETTTTMKAAYEASKATTDATLATDIEAEMLARVKADQRSVYDKAVETEIKTPVNATEVETLITTIKTNFEKATANEGKDPDFTNGLSALGLSEINDTTISAGGANGMVIVGASNAEFVLDGATMTETSNNFTVNGLTLNLVKTTESKESTADNKVYDSIQITVGKDSDSTYKLVKEALTEYNKLIEEMNKLYSADSARGYDPLTSEQKEAMTEDEIKNWEDKIKGSLLRRDNTLGSLLSGMRTALSSSYKDEDSGKTYSLSSFGIVTGNYTENGKLHIYGDEDDGTYATYSDKLKAALEEDPDLVMNTLTSVFSKLYETMTEKCAKTEISSALTFYNDKQYNTLLKGYEEDLSTLEDRIKDLEDKYYKQFTAMETALSKLQSQQNSLASLLGQTMQ